MFETMRFPLYLALLFVLLLLWQSWQSFNARQGEGVLSGEITFPNATDEASRDDVPAAVSSDFQEKGEIPVSVVSHNEKNWIRVETDALILWISRKGGDIKRLDLRKITVSNPEGDKPYRIFETNNRKYNMQSGLLHDTLPGVSRDSIAKLAPSHHAEYRTAAKEYRMEDGEDSLVVPLVWVNKEQGLEVEKRYVFTRGKYLFRLEHAVRNHSGVAWVGRQYSQLRRAEPREDEGSQLIYTYTGAAYYDGTYHKESFSDIKESPLLKSFTGGWAAMLQHYFLTALIPNADESNDCYTNAVGKGAREEYIIGLRSQPLALEAGESGSFAISVFAGPKLQNRLEEITKGLELSTDYGIFSIFSKPLFWLLDKIHSFVGNWGWAIIFLTALIKLVFYKLSEKSYKEMAKMRKFQPRVVTLRERYKDDRSRMQREVMELYKREKVNPLSGCLPILVQIPIFIALYWVLLESVELRQAPFALWINDLSVRDPYFVLPLLMGVSMFIQQKLSPAPPDPLQAKIMMALPIVFTIFFAFFPAGLVLYWFTNNVLSIIQQTVINRRIAAQEVA